MPKARLIVTLVEATIDKGEKKGSEPDVFCSVQVFDKTTFKTKTSKNSWTPSWNESMNSDLENLPNEISIECWAKGRLSDDCLGKVTIPFPAPNELVDKWFEFGPREGKKDKASMHGQIHVQLLVQPEIGSEREYKQIEKRWLDLVNPQELEKLDPVEKQRQEVIYELLTTEQAYVNDLKTITTTFLEPMRKRELFSKEEIGKVFSNIEAIMPININLVNELQVRAQPTMVIKEVGDLLLENADLFKLYAIYCSNQPIVPGLLEEYRKRDEVSAFLNETPVLATLRGLSFESLLIKPLQRVCKYPLLLKELSKYTPENHSDFSALNDANLKIKGIVDQINERTRQVESVLKLKAIAKTLSFNKSEKWKDFNLVQMQRTLVREGKARISSANKTKADAYLFLFSDMLLITRQQKKGYYHVKQDVAITTTICDLHDSDTFEIEVKTKIFSIQMTSKDEKKSWLTDISKLARKSRSETESRISKPPVARVASLRDPSMIGGSPSATPSPSQAPNPLHSAVDSSPESSPIIDRHRADSSRSSEPDAPTVTWSDQGPQHHNSLEKERNARILAESASEKLKVRVKELEEQNAALQRQVRELTRELNAAKGIVNEDPETPKAKEPEKTETVEQIEEKNAKEQEEAEEAKAAENLKKALELEAQKQQLADEEKAAAEQREREEKEKQERIQNERLKEIEKLLKQNDWDETKLLDEWQSAIDSMWDEDDWGDEGGSSLSLRSQDSPAVKSTASEHEKLAEGAPQASELEPTPSDPEAPKELKEIESPVLLPVEDSKESSEPARTEIPSNEPSESTPELARATPPQPTESTPEATATESVAAQPESVATEAESAPTPPLSATESLTPRETMSEPTEPEARSQPSDVTEPMSEATEPMGQTTESSETSQPSEQADTTEQGSTVSTASTVETSEKEHTPNESSSDATPRLDEEKSHTEVLKPIAVVEVIKVEPTRDNSSGTSSSEEFPSPSAIKAKQSSKNPVAPNSPGSSTSSKRVGSYLPKNSPPASPGSTRGNTRSQKETTNQDIQDLAKKKALLAALSKLEDKLSAARSSSQTNVNSARPVSARNPREPSPTPSSIPKASDSKGGAIVKSDSAPSVPASAPSGSNDTDDAESMKGSMREYVKPVANPSSLEKLLLSMIQDQK